MASSAPMTTYVPKKKSKKSKGKKAKKPLHKKVGTLVNGY